MAKEQNQLQKLLYESSLANGTNLVNFDDLKNLIDEGFSSNPDAYSIITYLINKMVGVPRKPYRKEGGKYIEITDPKIVALVDEANKTETLMQFNLMRFAFFYATGNSFVYAPRLQNGNNAGQLMEIGRINMPSQYVEIVSGGWRELVKGYIINYNYTSEPIPVDDVIHVKMVNLKYENGENFYGLSPIRVASLIIQSQNGGYESMASTLKRGFPSGILSKEDETDTDTTMAVNRIGVLRKFWERQFGKNKAKNTGTPLITAGKTTWTPVGFTNFKDLQVIETSQHGLRVLCNIFNLPSIILNDIAGTTFNNQSEVKKTVYTNRIIPDCMLFDQVDNIRIWKKYGFEVWSDFSQIPELQKNKTELVAVLNQAQAAGALLTANEIRKAIDLDEVQEDVMNMRFTSMGRIPVDQTLNDPNIDAALKNLGVDNYLK